MYDVIIIGSGVAGLAAAIYARRFMLNVLVLGDLPGGTITTTDVVENYPGFERISGIDLVQRLEAHATATGGEIRHEKVREVRKSEGGFTVKTDKEYESSAIIFATGSSYRKLNVPGEEEFASKGVSYCATCDGPLFKDKVVSVVGGSDAAAKEALQLSEYAKKVYIIYRREKIRAEPINQKRVEENPKIEIINNANVVEIKGNKMVKEVVLDKAFKGSRNLKLDGVFIEIGRIPQTELAKSLGVKLDDSGHINVDQRQHTNVKGVFAAGDVTNATSYKQAITAVAEGVKAAFEVYEYAKLQQ